MRSLLEEAESLGGGSWGGFCEQLRQYEDHRVPIWRLKLAKICVERELRKQLTAKGGHDVIRKQVFLGAGTWYGGKAPEGGGDAALGTTAWCQEYLKADNDCESAPLEILFGDMQRFLKLPHQPLEWNLTDFTARVNQQLLTQILCSTRYVIIDFIGEARRIVRQAKLRGLICSVRTLPNDPSGDPMARLVISGPIAIFRKTALYSKGLSDLLPFLGWSKRYRMWLSTGDAEARRWYLVQSGDPIFPSQAGVEKHDSQLELKFEKDFRKLRCGWDIIREPEALQSGSFTVFPDFMLSHPEKPGREPWYVEIIGFWTEDYLQHKKKVLESLAGLNWILCIDESLGKRLAMAEESFRIVYYRKRIDAKAVLEAVERGAV